MKEQELNFRQRRLLELLRARPDRDLYEGAGPDGKSGSGRFWVTYSADDQYEPGTWPDVRNMEAAGLLEEQWPGCYKLTGATRRPMVRRFGRR